MFETGLRAWRQRRHLSPSGAQAYWCGRWASTWPTSWCTSSTTCCWCLNDQPCRSSPTERAVACDFASLLGWCRGRPRGWEPAVPKFGWWAQCRSLDAARADTTASSRSRPPLSTMEPCSWGPTDLCSVCKWFAQSSFKFAMRDTTAEKGLHKVWINWVYQCKLIYLFAQGLFLVYIWFTSNSDKIAFLPALRVVVQAIDHGAVTVLQHGPTVGVLHVRPHPDAEQQHPAPVPAIVQCCSPPDVALERICQATLCLSASWPII